MVLLLALPRNALKEREIDVTRDAQNDRHPHTLTSIGSARAEVRGNAHCAGRVADAPPVIARSSIVALAAAPIVNTLPEPSNPPETIVAFIPAP